MCHLPNLAPIFSRGAAGPSEKTLTLHPFQCLRLLGATDFRLPGVEPSAGRPGDANGQTPEVAVAGHGSPNRRRARWVPTCFSFSCVSFLHRAAEVSEVDGFSWVLTVLT